MYKTICTWVFSCLNTRRLMNCDFVETLVFILHYQMCIIVYSSLYFFWNVINV